MKRLQPGVAALAILLLAGCGRGENTPGQPSAEERRALDNAAAKLDAEGAETYDTSPDSLVPAEGTAAAANEAAPANAAAATSSNTSANAAAGNNTAPR